MRGCVPAKTTLSDDGIAPDLRPFIEVLLNGDRETPKGTMAEIHKSKRLRDKEAQLAAQFESEVLRN